ncbi:MAG: glycosyltransferase family 2 protein [Chloroflexi bacterium]|nr:glycosyltransferase family 2 protein [Chloroflexota bacterium]
MLSEPHALVAVVVPAYGGERFIAETLESVRRSTFRHWQLIVVDDGSPDASGEIATKMACSDGRIRVLKQSNFGVCAARNAGARRADDGVEYLLFLDQDDLLDREMLDVMVETLERRPQVGMAFCRARSVDELGVVVKTDAYAGTEVARYVPHGLGFRRLRDDEPVTPFETLFACWSGCLPSTMLIRRSVFDRAGGWTEGFGQSAEDWDLALRLALVAEVWRVPRTLVSWRTHGSQASTDVANYWSQQDKLFGTWLRRRDLAPIERERIEQAWRFRQRVLLPWFACREATRDLSKGRLWPAARGYARAAARLIGLVGLLSAYRRSTS